jgi:hypothetical protein
MRLLGVLIGCFFPAFGCLPECKPSTSIDLDVSASVPFAPSRAVVVDVSSDFFTARTGDVDVVVRVPLRENDAIVRDAEVELEKTSDVFTVTDTDGLLLEILSTKIGADAGDEGGVGAPEGIYASVADGPAQDRCSKNGLEQESVPVKFDDTDYYTGADEIVPIGEKFYRVNVGRSAVEVSTLSGDELRSYLIAAFVVRQKE